MCENNDLHDALELAERRKVLPTVVAYNRIDGPGSSLDIRAFQQAFWALRSIPNNAEQDPTMEWTRELPRTVGISIDTGTRVQAEPFERGRIAVRSADYGTEAVGKLGEVLPTKENWLLKIVELFGLSGVLFVLHNLRAGTQSSGLGGSATATAAVAILANELAGRPFGPIQLVSLASRMEDDLGVSITGTQEQSNVLFGGVTDYVWFPWGIPGLPDSGYGSSLRTSLIGPGDYAELERRMAIIHTGVMRPSTDVNSVWTRRLQDAGGYQIHKSKLDCAYIFREGLRRRDWAGIVESINRYRELRTDLCPAYMDGAHEIAGFARDAGGAAFPLGAGGGGGVLVFAAEPQVLDALRTELHGAYRVIPFTIKPQGHEITDLPLSRE